ncbi:MAG TPA: GntR family transcriptional regulator [Sphingomonadaceae bacterium]|nr:GntR family transcriptional regulator [Sphingomonadaceae bacterium]
MNSGATTERVYDALKRQILTRTFRPGDRLEPAALAENLASSVTPVRDALHLLTGQGLVTSRTGGGFHMPSLDEPSLIDLYAWSSELLLVVVRAWPAGLAGEGGGSGLSNHGSTAEEIAALFSDIAGRSTNAEHGMAVRSLNARLHAVRLAEPHVIEGIEEEVAAMREALKAVDGTTLRRLVGAYHRRRQRHAAEIVRALYRGS